MDSVVLFGIQMGAMTAIFGHQIWMSYKLGRVEQKVKDLNGYVKDKRG